MVAMEVVYYCGRDHEVSDGDRHKAYCVAVEEARALLDEYDLELREVVVFEKAAGRFWDLWYTRRYMHTMLKIDRIDALETLLNHLLDMCCLGRRGRMSVFGSIRIPMLCLRLGKDQEAGDDFSRRGQSFPKTKDVDAFESHRLWLMWQPLDKYHSVAVMLVKVRIFPTCRPYRTTQEPCKDLFLRKLSIPSTGRRLTTSSQIILGL